MKKHIKDLITGKKQIKKRTVKQPKVKREKIRGKVSTVQQDKLKRTRKRIKKLEGRPNLIVGRPPRTVYSELMADRICELVASGQSLKKIALIEGYPSASTILEWAKYPDEVSRPGFQERFAKAKEIGYHLMAEEIVEIADDSGKDKIKKTLPNGKVIEVIDHENIQRDKLRVDARFRIISKTLPDIYGDKLKVEHSGSVDLISRLAGARRRLIAEEAAGEGLIEAAPESVEKV